MTTPACQHHIRQLIRALSKPNRKANTAAALAVASTPTRVKRFVGDNLRERFEKLYNQLAFVADSFENFGGLIIEFIRAKRLPAIDCGLSDGEEMLKWLLATQELSGLQRDYITWQRAKQTTEEMARSDRLAYVRFQQLDRAEDNLLSYLDSNRTLRIAINTTRNWATFKTDELLGDDCQTPANVLFFAARGKIATAVLELEGQALLNELVDYQPCSIADLTHVSNWAERDELIAFYRDLTNIGLLTIS